MTNKKTIKQNLSISREHQKEQGFFDGRFVERKQTPKKDKKRYKTGKRKLKHKKNYLN